MSVKVRHAELSITYSGRDISQDVAPVLLSFDYNDIFNSKSTDDLQVVFEDKDGLWRSEWFPERGAKLTASLTCHDWPGGMVLDCGSFEIDDVHFVGPPNTCTISAVAVGITSSIRRQRFNKAWENVSVKEIAEEVTGKHGFQLVFDSGVNPTLIRYDQREQTDMEMLGELCDNNGLGIKATDGKILMYEEKLYDQRGAEITFTRNSGGYKRHRLRVSASDIYTACEVKYIDPQTRMLIKYKHEPGSSNWSSEPPPSGYVLKINQRCECQADAERLAKSALRDQNKQEATGTLDFIGNPEIHSGKIAALSDFGRFDSGKFMIEKVRHHYDKRNGYSTSVEIRGTLDY